MEDLITPQKAAKMLGVTPESLRNWEISGKIQCVKTIGGHRRFKLKDVEKLLNNKCDI